MCRTPNYPMRRLAGKEWTDDRDNPADHRGGGRYSRPIGCPCCPRPSLSAGSAQASSPVTAAPRVWLKPSARMTTSSSRRRSRSFCWASPKPSQCGRWLSKILGVLPVAARFASAYGPNRSHSTSGALQFAGGLSVMLPGNLDRDPARAGRGEIAAYRLERRSGQVFRDRWREHRWTPCCPWPKRSAPG